MKNLKLLAVLSATSLLTACASGPKVAEKGKSSDALQIVTSAGSGEIFRDKHVPKDEVGDVGMAGYVGSTLMGMSLGTMVTGFNIAVMADSTFGWEYTNFVMYFDAKKVEGLDKDQVCGLVSKEMTKTMPNDLEALQSFATVDLKPSDYVQKSRYNGGAYKCVEGYQISNATESVPFPIQFRNDDLLIGSSVNVRGVSEPLETSTFNDDLRSKMPSNTVVAVRFNFESSHLWNLKYPNKNDVKFVSSQGLSSSPMIQLPPTTFMSVPRKEYLNETHYIPSISMVRDNDNAYFFVKPDADVPTSIPLVEYHNQFARSYQQSVDKLKKEL
jgi:hypothetical protein